MRLLYFSGLVLATTLAAPSGARAQAYESPSLLGVGGARRALGTTTEALFSNPAGLSASKRFDVEVGYADDLRESDRRVNIALADGKAGPVGGGLALTYERIRPPGELEGTRRLEGLRLDIGTAVPVGQGLILGVATRYFDYRLLDGDNEVEGGGSSDFAFDLGLLWQTGEGISIGLVLENFTDIEQPNLPRAWGAGLGWQSGAFSLEVDIDHPWEREDPKYTGALSFTLAERVPLRAAVTFDQQTERFTVSAGAGFIHERVGFDVAYRQIVDPQGEGEDADQRMLVGSFRVSVF